MPPPLDASPQGDLGRATRWALLVAHPFEEPAAGQ